MTLTYKCRPEDVGELIASIVKEGLMFEAEYYKPTLTLTITFTGGF